MEVEHPSSTDNTKNALFFSSIIWILYLESDWIYPLKGLYKTFINWNDGGLPIENMVKDISTWSKKAPCVLNETCEFRFLSEF